VVVNWRRIVQWPDRPDLMAFWSAPMVGFDMALPKPPQVGR
jgi:hypothetical protein